MLPIAAFITKILSFFTVIGGLLIIALCAILLLKKILSNNKFIKSVLDFFASQAILFSFLITLCGAISSLFYSQIVGFVPCNLCWWQRIFLYPQVFILGFALWKKDIILEKISLLFSVIGTIIAAYNSYLQFGGSPLIPCAATAASCAQRYFLEFGYVTIPTMSLTAFGLIILFLLIKKTNNSSEYR